MSGFLYFLPDVSGRPDAQTIERFELQNLLNTGFINVEVFSGPDGMKGSVVTPKVHGRPLVETSQLGYFPDRQIWTEKGDCRLGHFTKTPPTPQSLKRESMLIGHDCNDSSGNSWHVPVARSLSQEDGDLRWSISLPQRSVLVDGHWQTGAVVDSYLGLWKTSEDVWKEFTESSVEESSMMRLSFDDAHAAAVLALSTNYHVEKEELNAMGCFDTPFVRDVLESLVDFPSFRQMVEKKTSKES